ncbi:hypothetical protein HHI36_010687, partial [Cryptolaemus montrouzieri]
MATALNSKQCDICKVFFSSSNDSILHYQGKKHKRLAAQDKDVTCGVFITGFTVGKTKEELLQYFSKFGAIDKTHVGPKLDYIILVYEKESEALSVVKTPHYIDGMKLIVERRKPFIRM